MLRKALVLMVLLALLGLAPGLTHVGQAQSATSCNPVCTNHTLCCIKTDGKAVCVSETCPLACPEPCCLVNCVWTCCHP